MNLHRFENLMMLRNLRKTYLELGCSLFLYKMSWILDIAQSWYHIYPKLTMPELRHEIKYFDFEEIEGERVFFFWWTLYVRILSADFKCIGNMCFHIRPYLHRPAMNDLPTDSSITFEPLNRFRKSWAFWISPERGYLMAYSISQNTKQI